MELDETYDRSTWTPKTDNVRATYGQNNICRPVMPEKPELFFWNLRAGVKPETINFSVVAWSSTRPTIGVLGLQKRTSYEQLMTKTRLAHRLCRKNLNCFSGICQRSRNLKPNILASLRGARRDLRLEYLDSRNAHRTSNL